MNNPKRSYALLVGDGMADYADSRLGGKTPLEFAKTPAMDTIARSGHVGLLQTIPAGLPPGSDIGNMSLFGYDPRKFFSGRAPIEAAAMGITLAPNQVAFRCNLVYVAGDTMGDYAGGHFDPVETAEIIGALQTALADEGCDFRVGVDYRHLCILKDIDVSDLSTTPPHDITGKPWCDHLPHGLVAARVAAIMEKAKPVLAACSVNRRRMLAGKTPANAIWLWGQGRAISFPTLAQRYDLTGSVISAVDLVRGLGKLAGLDALRIPGATGYLGTNYRGKVDAAFSALETQDFVFVHVEAPDETSHEGDLQKKIQAIEEFDANIVAPFVNLQKQRPDLRILVTPDHITALSTKTHASEAIPFTVCGPGISGGRFESYGETIASKIPVITGSEMFKRFIRGTF